jgi:ABC-type transporter Mla MlaB component
MSLFSKPPAKKAEPPKHPAKPRSDGAREPAGGAVEKPRRDGPLTMLKWSPERPPIEVDETTPGLCAVLENAALLFASGQEAPARAMLEQGVVSDPEARVSPLAWQALFDLLQRAGDRSAFDQLALRYVVQFEQLAPTWEPQATPQVAPRQVIGGQFSLTGKITGASGAQLEGLKRAIGKQMPNAKVSFAGVTGIDDDGARLVATCLAEARRAGLPLEFQHVEAVQPLLAKAFEQGREGGEGLWILGLELLQWQSKRDEFEERAIDFAVAFELSPPSWEPPAASGSPTPALAAAPPVAAAESAGEADEDVLRWSGVIAGSALQQLGQLAEFAEQRALVTIDMRAVDRVDWVCAGALLNAITRLEARHKTVQLAGATPIVRALLLLIGIPFRQFIRKA